jgi:hypothetical protein
MAAVLTRNRGDEGYHRGMARGWESKSVEDQVEQRSEQAHFADAAAKNTEDQAAKAAKLRERQALELQRERILDERTSNPIRRAALAAALGEIEAKLGGL